MKVSNANAVFNHTLLYCIIANKGIVYPAMSSIECGIGFKAYSLSGIINGFIEAYKKKI